MPRPAAFALAVALLPGVPGLAQQADPSRPVKSKVESVGAEVEVLVLDAKGKPVEGLGKGDLKLFVNGRETPIDYLEAPPTSPAAAVVPSATPAMAPAAPPAPVRLAHSTVFVVNPLHLDARSRQNGLAALRRFVDAMPAGEAATVFVVDNGLRRLVGFTSDRKELKKALDRAEKGLPAAYNFEVGSEEWISRTRQELRTIATLFDSVAARPEPKTAVILVGSVAATGLTAPIGGAAGSEAATQKRYETGVARNIPGSRAGFSNRGDPGPPPPTTDVLPGGAPPIATRGAWSFLPDLKVVAGAALLARATILAVDPTELTTDAARAETNSLAISGSLFDS